ncbi:MAG: amidohydrolase family protein, partial [Myxococcales bacterium]|nr:amidohydrolase family protein [Myxococcales bacterium]
MPTPQPSADTTDDIQVNDQTTTDLAVDADLGTDSGNDTEENDQQVQTDVTPDTVADLAADLGADAGEFIPDPVMNPREPAEVVTCEDTIPTVSEGNCDVTAGSNDLVVLRGAVITPDTVYQNGYVVYDGGTENGLIQCVGCDCSSVSGIGNATVVACPDAVISPAMLNPHEHITYARTAPISHGTTRYDHRHEWRADFGTFDYDDDNDNSPSVDWGEWRHLISGTTSMSGAGYSDGIVRNLDRDQQEGLAQTRVKNSTFPLGDSSRSTSGIRTGDCNYGNGDSISAATTPDAYVPHVSEGIGLGAENEFLCLTSTDNGGEDLLNDNTAMIHAIGLNAGDLLEASLDGISIVWSPRSNIDLYGMTANVVTADQLGVGISLGTDWLPSGSMNMLRELACADYLNQNHYNHYFSDEDLIKMATLWAAQAMAVDDVVGTLAQGYVADIAVYNGDASSPFRTILDAGPGDVVLVLRGAIPLFGDANVMTGLGADEDCDAIDVCTVSKSICVDLESGVSYSQLRESQPSGRYDLWHCDTPPNEPSCVPARPGEFDGIATANDNDGDGIPNSEDNCPDVFNPAMP